VVVAVVELAQRLVLMVDQVVVVAELEQYLVEQDLVILGQVAHRLLLLLMDGAVMVVLLLLDLVLLLAVVVLVVLEATHLLLMVERVVLE
jgi:hypothetical protein